MLGIMIPSFAFAADPSYGLQGASKGTGLINTVTGKPTLTVPQLIGQVIGVALSFVGAIFFILVLYAGFLWMTAFGSSEKVDKAKDILLHAAIGLVIVLAAYAISTFVFSALTGTTETTVTTEEVNTSVSCCNVPSEQACIGGLTEEECGTYGTDTSWQAGECVSSFCSY